MFLVAAALQELDPDSVISAAFGGGPSGQNPSDSNVEDANTVAAALDAGDSQEEPGEDEEEALRH